LAGNLGIRLQDKKFFKEQTIEIFEGNRMEGIFVELEMLSLRGTEKI
jgi:hypothetical protein